MSIEEAAEKAGIPFEEVFDRAQNAMRHGEATQWQMLLISQSALQTGLEVLQKIANAGPRYDSDGGVDPETGQVVPVDKLHNTDLDAAKALTKFGLDAVKLSLGFNLRGRQIQNAKPVGSQANDLFDLLAPNPWDLKKIDG